MDSQTWDRIQVEARRRIRAQEARQEARVRAWERAKREANRPRDAPPVGFVAELIEHRCPECGYRLWIQRELIEQEYACSGCDFVGTFEPREDA